MSAHPRSPSLHGRSGGSGISPPEAGGAGAEAALAQRNIECHRLGAEAANAREVPTELLAPDFRLENRVTAVTDNSYHGTDGWREWMGDLFDVFSADARYEVEEIIAASAEYVAALLCVSGVGARSGQPLSFRWVGVTWFSNGKALRAVGYASRSEALAALGLDE
jgi:ketosteroid isomerase-like protein